MAGQPAALQAAAGWKHSAAVSASGRLHTWGWGGSMGTTTPMTGQHSSGGQLGLGNELDWWGPTCVKSFEDEQGFVAQQHGDTESGSAPWLVKQVACGFNHTAAVIGLAERLH